MVNKIVVISICVVSILVLTGVGVLIWVLVRSENNYETILLEGEGFGDVEFTAAYTRIQGRGDMFWWFYPALVEERTSKPVLLVVDGVTGIAPSFLANFGIFGPYDMYLNRRNNSWVNDYHLLFLDAPLGTGFSTIEDLDLGKYPNLEDNVEHILSTLKSFYDVHNDYRDTSLYILSQGDGSQLAVPTAIEISKDAELSARLEGIILGNPVVSPAKVLTKLGFYLEELAYVDGNGRNAIEILANETKSLVDNSAFDEAFDFFTSLDTFINENAGAVAVNLRHIVDKLSKDSSIDLSDYFGEKYYFRHIFPDVDIISFMQDTVSPALGIPAQVIYDRGRAGVTQSFKGFYMKSIENKVAEILEKTNKRIIIYNGNLDAVSNTPGQLEWINNLQWPGQSEFLNKSRITLDINNQIEGYYRKSDRLEFYWINVAGYLVPLDNPVAAKCLVDLSSSVREHC